MTKFLPLILLLFVAPGLAVGQESWDEVVSFARRQHEIVLLLIEKHQYDQAAEESRKIFAKKFPPEKQSLLVDSARVFADTLIHQSHKQYEIANEILDQCLAAVDAPKLKAEIYKEKTYAYRKMGQNDKAMECWKKAVELENSTQP